MSSGQQWEALPQRTRKRRPVASASAAITTTNTAATTHPGLRPTAADRLPGDGLSLEGPPSTPPRPPQPHAAAAAVAAASPPDAPTAPAARESGAETNAGAVRAESFPEVGHGDQKQQKQRQQHRLASSSSSSSGGGASQPSASPPGESDGVQESKCDGDRQQQTPSVGNRSSAGGSGDSPPVPSPTALGGEERIRKGGRQGGGMGEGGTVDAATISARHAAVATAVDARSKMARFSEGLGGGAGADGGADGEANFEYLDHTADVQLHSWGDSIERAMEGALAAMFNTITDLAKVDIDPSLTKSLDIEGHDAKSLLFSLLDEFLFLFHSEGLVVKKATVDGTINRADGGGGSGGGGRGGGEGSSPSSRWRIRATAEGETFDLAKHPQGTEVKAITYSNMQINEAPDGRTDIYVIVDI